MVFNRKAFKIHHKAAECQLYLYPFIFVFVCLAKHDLFLAKL